MVNDICREASEIEAFDPKLKGLECQISGLFKGQDLSSGFLDKIDPGLVGEPLTGIAFKLNLLAGTYYQKGEIAEAKRICRAALMLYRAVIGPDHPDTKVVAQNLLLLDAGGAQDSSAKQLPPIKKFKR
ncbi:MAG: tetratricopeptide repeat protein [Cryomorphaceae bacterium]|nr:tetratricopeptide repeat protein [Cryomorphaceae bacterium]